VIVGELVAGVGLLSLGTVRGELVAGVGLLLLVLS
jgi:hypothetical protein